MTHKEEQVKMVKEIGAMIAADKRYEVYGRELSNVGSYCLYIVTPNGNVMTCQPSEWWGVLFTLEYKPSRENGSGCRCLSDDGITHVSMETVRDAEGDGLAFAKRLGAKLYKSPDEYFVGYHSKERMVRL